MGQVWRALDTTLQTTVALKLVLPERVDEVSLVRFAREARPPGRLARIRKWVRRNPTAATGGAVALAALVVVSFLLAQVSRSAAVAEERAKDVLRLSTLQDVEALLADVSTQWPPHPDRRDELGDWLSRGGKLLASLPEFVAKREALASLAIPQTEEERETERLGHPGLPRLLSLDAQIASRTAAIQCWRGEAKVELPDLSDLNALDLPADIDAAVILRRTSDDATFEDWESMYDWAWRRLEPHRAVPGEEGLGLALALLCAPDAHEDGRAQYEGVVAHGWAVNGDLEAAREAAELSLELATDVSRAEVDVAYASAMREIERYTDADNWLRPIPGWRFRERPI